MRDECPRLGGEQVVTYRPDEYGPSSSAGVRSDQIVGDKIRSGVRDWDPLPVQVLDPDPVTRPGSPSRQQLADRVTVP
jgi:hypothetical protein